MKFFFKKTFRNLIANFRSLPEENTMSVLRKPKTIGFLIKKVMNNNFTDKTVQDIIQDNWNKLIDPVFVGRTIPSKISNENVLIVTCQNTVIRSEMQLRRPSLLEKVNNLPRCEKIIDIKFIA